MDLEKVRARPIHDSKSSIHTSKISKIIQEDLRIADVSDKGKDKDMPDKDKDKDNDDKDKLSMHHQYLARKKNNLKTTHAQKKSSMPNAHPGHDKKPSKILDHFMDLASAKEVTNQKELDLKRLQLQNARVKIKAKVDIQIQRDKLKAKLRMLEKKQEHDFHIVQLNLQIVQGQGCDAPRSLLSDFYNNSPGPSQAGVTGLFKADEFKFSPSFSPGASTAFDLESFDYSTPLSSSSHLPTLPLSPARDKRLQACLVEHLVE